MVKNILIVADLGAGANIVKNLLLTGEYAWPLHKDKFSVLITQYHKDLELRNWLKQEYILRYWKEFFGIDLSDDLNHDQYREQLIPQDLPIIFINHSAFYQIEEFYKFSRDLEILFVSPTTDLGLEWQIRSYCEKKTVELLHDFSFDLDREKSVKNHKDRYGEEAYYEMNIANMKEIISRRQKEFREKINSQDDFLPLEILLFGSVSDVVDFLNNKFKQDLPIHQVGQILEAWKSRHWPLEQTDNWKYHHLFL